MKATVVTEKDETEKILEQFLFEKDMDLKSWEKENLDINVSSDQADGEIMPFLIDTTGDVSIKHANLGQEILESPPKKQKTEQEKTPVWHDSDDENVEVDIKKDSRLRKLRHSYNEEKINGIEYQQRLRDQHERIFSKPKWAKKKASNNETSVSKDIRLFQIKQSSPDLIDICRVRDANVEDRSQCVIQKIEFHSNSRVLFTVGLDKVLRLFHIDGVNNTKIQSIYVQDLPITCASFTPDGKNIILSGHRPYFYCYDIENSNMRRIFRIHGREEKTLSSFIVSPCNRWIVFFGDKGYSLIVSATTLQLVGELKMNGFVRTGCFSADGNSLFTFGGEGLVYHWDIENQRCLNKFRDEGCIKGTAIAISPCGSYLACGSESGIVNIYSLNDVSSKNNAAPLKSIMSLTTAVDGITFHPSSSLMAIFSRSRKDQLRLISLPMFKTITNWPTSLTPFKYVQCVSFSPCGNYIAVGNDKGSALLYQIRGKE